MRILSHFGSLIQTTKSLILVLSLVTKYLWISPPSTPLALSIQLIWTNIFPFKSLLSFFYLLTTSSLLRTVSDPFPLPSSLYQLPVLWSLPWPTLSPLPSLSTLSFRLFFLGLMQRPSTVLPVQSTPSLPASALHVSEHHFPTHLQWISTSYQIKSKLLGLIFKTPLHLPSACPWCCIFHTCCPLCSSLREVMPCSWKPDEPSQLFWFSLLHPIQILPIL